MAQLPDRLETQQHQAAAVVVGADLREPPLDPFDAARDLVLRALSRKPEEPDESPTE